MTEILKVTPPLWELYGKDEYVCPEDGCDSIFKKSSNLHMHLVKHHKIGTIEPKSRDTLYQFACPVEGCPRNVNNSAKKYFASKKLLKQHYAKTHAEKIYSCTKCDRKFSILSVLNRHKACCGAKYICGVCNWEYNTNESLIVHLSRKHPETHKKYLDINNSSKKKPMDTNNREVLIYSNDNSVPVLDEIVKNNKCSPNASDESANTSRIEANDQINNIRQTGIWKNDIPFNSQIKIIKNMNSAGSQLADGKSKVEVMANFSKSILKKLPIVIMSPSNTYKLFSKPNSLPADNKTNGKIQQIHQSHVMSPSSLSNYKVVSIKNIPKTTMKTVNDMNKFKIDMGINILNASSESQYESELVSKTGIKDSFVENKINVAEKCNDFGEDLSNYADRFTQTILKTVKKSNKLVTVKNTVETQTSSINVTKKAKIKIDKATNSVYKNGQFITDKSFKRTLATQTIPKPFKNISNSNKDSHVNNKIATLKQSSNNSSILNTYLNPSKDSEISFKKLPIMPNISLGVAETPGETLSNKIKCTKDFMVDSKNSSKKLNNRSIKRVGILKKTNACDRSAADAISKKKHANQTNASCQNNDSTLHVESCDTTLEITEADRATDSRRNKNVIYSMNKQKIEACDTKMIIDEETASNSKSIEATQPTDSDSADVISINSLTDLAKDGDDSLEKIFNNNSDYLDTYNAEKKTDTGCTLKTSYEAMSSSQSSDLNKIPSCYGSYSNIETQTALDELLYSNIPNKQQILENEIKNDDLLFSNFICLSDIQTQTSWPIDYDMDIENLQDSLSGSDHVCMDPGSLFTSAETQTIDDVLDFVSDFSPSINDNGESIANVPDLSFKGTQTGFCFLDSPMNYGDMDNSILGNVCDFTHMSGTNSGKSMCTSSGLLNSKSDVLLSLPSAETQTCFEDCNLNVESIDGEKDIDSTCL